MTTIPLGSPERVHRLLAASQGACCIHSSLSLSCALSLVTRACRAPRLKEFVKTKLNALRDNCNNGQDISNAKRPRPRQKAACPHCQQAPSLRASKRRPPKVRPVRFCALTPEVPDWAEGRHTFSRSGAAFSSLVSTVIFLPFHARCCCVCLRVSKARCINTYSNNYKGNRVS
ncbi:hypothetical protein EJ05DRAFT_363692 [Pseudovirgaria hyperparasitica]|uniref:Uncharacterized protein n=1 Tax=Pseudovirgaria hyperparasitica TaxID=470096 RepID=A0A6A6W8A4_9PEZI|nr:uncharacterized protein EJ05DRAFT_363692 [Pseudovirgaria hyperparasitica]KAF2758775.1 hypothetical protein EJ05DRAFT_363692 [Pseudovirgaria hyperparasitica]